MIKRREFIAGLGGTAAAWPAVAWAQQPAMPVVGYLRGGKENGVPRLAAAFGQGLGNRVMSRGGMLRFWTGGREPETIAYGRWRRIWRAAKSQ
jgi:hypothetical protein